MAIPYGSSIDLGKRELQNAVLQVLSSAPSSPAEGQMYYNSTDQTAYIRKNGSWLDLGVQGGAGATDLSSTLTATSVAINSNTGADVTIASADGTNAGVFTSAQFTKLSGIATGATANDTDANLKSRANHTGSQTASTISDFQSTVSANTDVAANTAARHTHSNSTVLNNTTASFTTADETKLDHVTVTQAVDLDAIESRVNALDASVVLMGTWDASAGTFPGGGTAQAGASYIVSVAGTVNSIPFSINDRILAITDNASTSTYAANWLKLDYTDQVLSVAGQTGAVTLAKGDVGLGNVTNDAQLKIASNLSDVNNAATAFGNIKQEASTSATGVVELATTNETKARSSSSVVVTPDGLADFMRGYAATIGDGSTSNIVVTHNLGTQNIVPAVRDATTNTGVEVEWEATSTSTATFKFATAPSSGAYKVVIAGL
jgi:hypothetical protein